MEHGQDPSHVSYEDATAQPRWQITSTILESNETSDQVIQGLCPFINSLGTSEGIRESVMDEISNMDDIAIERSPLAAEQTSSDADPFLPPLYKH